jgi:competence protein ComEA
MKREHFYFTKKERLGFLGLVLLALILLMGTFCVRKLIVPKAYELNLPELMDTEQEVAEPFSTKEKKVQKYSANKAKKNTGQKRDSKKERLLFHFDPNTLSYDSLLLLGLTKYAANNMIRYRDKGGKIRNAQKFMEIYGVEEADSVLIPYLKFDTRLTENVDKNDKAYKAAAIQVKTMHFVNINTADTLELQLLSGIGPYYARSIYFYRERLGGFLTEDQLYEISSLQPETIEKIIPYLTFDHTAIRKIKINEIEVRELGRHPYISFPQAKVVINYRNNHGAFKTTQDLKKVKVLSESEISLLEPYLDFGYDRVAEQANN